MKNCISEDEFITLTDSQKTKYSILLEHIQTDQLEEAKAILQSIEEKQKRKPTLNYIIKGVIEKNQGNTSQAIRFFKKALDQEESIYTYHALTNILISTGNVSEAQKLFAKAKRKGINLIRDCK